MQILTEETTPLRFTEVCRRVRERSEGPWSEPTIRRVLATLGARPFTRGVLGLRSHLSLSEQDLAELRVAAEAIICRGTQARRWHAAELVEILNDEASDGDEGAQPPARLEIVDLCVSLLRRTGRPLSTDELREGVGGVRGVNRTFLITPRGGIARLAPGTWGLVDRDFGTEGERTLILDSLENLLAQRGKAVHWNTGTPSSC